MLHLVGLSAFVAMLIGHALADYPLQADFLAQGKNRHTAVGREWWPWLLGSHALIHGGFVWAITGSMALGLAEAGCHATIDFLKCEKRIGFHTDQTMHVVCKVLWALIASGVSVPTALLLILMGAGAAGFVWMVVAVGLCAKASETP